MDEYKVQGEPLVLSLSQERVLCIANQQEEETAAVYFKHCLLMTCFGILSTRFFGASLKGGQDSGLKLKDRSRLI